jgi:Glycosyltransferase family 87
VGDAEHRLLLRRARRFGGPPRGASGASGAAEEEVVPSGLDVFVVPSLLLLIARDLLVRDPLRVLAWRLLHESRLSSFPWLAPLLPAPSGDIDRDPIALVLAAVATLLAAIYVGGAILGKRERFRAGVLVLAAFALVVLPTSGFMAMGYALGRPYGQDGGIVQLPLAMDKIVAGESPYDTDYGHTPAGAETILAREVKASRVWGPHEGGPLRGPNPLLHHHAYLPGTHLLMLPFHLAARAAGTTFDPRVVTLAAYFAAALLAARLAGRAALTAAALVLLNPLVYWHQIFGANDIVFVAMILGAALLLRSRPLAAAALLGLACATKQLAWPFAPFLLLAAGGDFRAWPRQAFTRVARMALVAAAVFAAVVLPVAARDFHAFYVDIFGYNVGLPGVTNYPLGGTPGFGFANFLIYFGAVRSLGEYFPFGIFYLLLVPLVLFFLRAAFCRREPAHALALGAAALLASLYFSRVVHPNYLIPLATVLPVAILAGAFSADIAIVPLLLLAVAAEIAEQSPLKLLWDDAVAARFPQHAGALARLLCPRNGPGLTDDPLSLAWSAVAAGLATAYLCAALLGARARARVALSALAVGLVVMAPLLVVVGLGERTVVRAQDEWVVEVRAAAQTLARGRTGSAPRAREAVPTSFREEPARRLEADRWPVPAGSALVDAGLRLLGPMSDPRLLSAVAALVLLALVCAVAPPSSAPWLLGALLFVPPAVTTVVLGGPSMIVLAGLAAALLLPAGQRALLRGVGLAIAAACSVGGGLAALALLAHERGPARGRVAYVMGVGVVLGYGVVALAGAAFTSPPGVGLGVVNFWLYFGYAPGPTVIASLLLAALGVSVMLLRSVAAGELSGGAAAAMITLLALVTAPSAAPDAVLLPIGLLALTAAGDAEAADEPAVALAA